MARPDARVSDEADINARKVAYLDKIRGLYRRERTVGLVGCLVGVLLLVLARYRFDAPWLMWTAVGVVAASWLLFAYVIFRRTSWVRTHPFDPNG